MEFRNTGRIIRMKHDGKSGGYTPISNKILQSKTLSPVQKSILVHLLSLKPDWVIRKTHLHKEMNIGRDCFLKGFNGLVTLGYILEKPITTNNLKCYDYTVLEEPISDILEFSNTEIQFDKEPVTIESKERENNNLESNTVLTSSIERIYTGATILGQNEDDIFKLRNLRLQYLYELREHLIGATSLRKEILSFIFYNKLDELLKKIGEEKYLEIQPYIENYLLVYNEPEIDLRDGNNQIHLPKITRI